MTPGLEAAIANAWRVFGKAPVPDSLAICDCCGLNMRDQRGILRTPRREIAELDLGLWYDPAFYPEKDGEQVLRYLLPRIFELLPAVEWLRSIGDQIALQRLPECGFPEGWSPKERSAITGYLAALGASIAAAPDVWDDRLNLSDFLCIVVTGGIDVSPVLEALDAAPDAGLARAIALAVEALGLLDEDAMFGDPFWPSHLFDAQANAVRRWLARDDLRRRVLAAAGVETDRARHQALLEAAAYIGLWTEIVRAEGAAE